MLKSFHFYRRATTGIICLLAALLIVSNNAAGQANSLPKVTVIDEKGLAELIKPKGKPVMINFWATWCVPCREEFPDLVKLDAEYKGKIDFFTVSLDFEEELKTSVPNFLASMKAEMPAYLLLTADEDAAISSVSKEWRGGLPFTIIFAPDGSSAYAHQGLIKLDTVRPIIDGFFSYRHSAPIIGQTHVSRQIIVSPLSPNAMTFERGVDQAKKDFSEGKYQIRKFCLMPWLTFEIYRELTAKFKLTISDTSCKDIEGEDDFIFGYNETMKEQLLNKHGSSMKEHLSFAQIRPHKTSLNQN